MGAYKTNRGHWQVNFSENGKQRILYLGQDFDAGSANRIARMVADILVYRKRGESLPTEILSQIEGLHPKVREKLEKRGLVDGGIGWSLADLLKAFYETKSHLKPSTQSRYRDLGNNLLSFFGKDKRISSIKKSDCERFVTQLLSDYASSTVSVGLRRFRTIFKFAVESGLISKNPFDKIKGGADVNEDRHIYVVGETVHKVMSSCRDDHDRLLLALARFAGLRIPSEVRHMRYSDFSDNEIRIHKNTKTGARVVPLFGEVRKVLDRIIAAQGKDFNSLGLVFPKLGCFRERIIKAIDQSGMKRWAKLFVNLRSSCITDLDERGYSEKTMDAIFGNSAVVRKRHYVKFRRDREYAKVLRDDAALHDSQCCSGHDSQCCFTDQLRDRLQQTVISEAEKDEFFVVMNLVLDRFGAGRRAL
jgi:site-specific recombinase XerD